MNHSNLSTFKWLTLLTLLIMMLQSSNSQVIWTDYAQIRSSQTSIYDTAYIPLGIISPVTINYKTSFTAGSIIKHTAFVISGFQNYLHYQMIINVTMGAVSLTGFTANIYVGIETYIKQLNVNYFVMIANPTYDPFVFVSIGNYRTLDLDNGTGLRTQPFANQTVSAFFINPKRVWSAFHGLEYYNNDGVLNILDMKTWMNANSSIINHQISIDQKGIINYLSTTTIVISASFPQINAYKNLMSYFADTITDVAGFVDLNFISASDLFQQTDNSLFFGMRGFNFTMEGTRLFLLEITNLTNYRDNLQTNTYMKYTKLNFLLMAKRSCTILTDYFYINGYDCRPNCTGLQQDIPNLLCQDCLSICNGCTTGPNICVNCTAGNNRIIAAVAPLTCVCDTANGYVQVTGQDKCQNCSSFIPGCLKCSDVNTCIDCGNTSLFGNDTSVPGKVTCKCLMTGDRMVTGLCLNYPGCLIANIYITGGFCQLCDDPHNFQPDLINNSSCVCKAAYKLDNITDYCVDICGDSQTPDDPLICDDGNTQSGDGCSSTCKPQYGYVCTVANVGGISLCAEKQQIKINYLYAEKTLINNQGILVFSLLPAQHFLTESTFENSVSLNIPGSKKIKFDPTTSLIYITMDYTQPLEGNQYQVNFTFTGLKISSPDINLKLTLTGLNAKLKTSDKHQQTNIIVYVGLAISAFALVLALTASFLGQKMMGIELILPIQAAFFTLSTLPKNVFSPISALWSMKFSNGYNVFQTYDMSTNYMLDNRLAIMQYAGQYILNYNFMFILLATVIAIIGMIVIRIAWLQREQKNLQALQKKKQDQQKNQPNKNKKQKTKKPKQKNQDGDEKDQKDQNETEQQTVKQEEINLQTLEQQLEDCRQNIKNWKNFMYMIFDRFFSILIITAMMKVIFCFYVQLSNLTYTAQVYDNSLNAGFFFLTYATIVTGLYAIVYDYKTDKLILFTCNKGKYAIIYIFTFVGYIIVLGALFQSSIAAYIAALFSIISIVVIPYQKPYGLSVFDFQILIAMICQLPFLSAASISILLNIQGQSIDESLSFIFAYAILGTTGLAIVLTIIRLIRMIDCKKISCFEFTDRKKDNANDKNKKKNKVVLLQIDMEKDYDEFSQDSVRAVLFERKKQQKAQDFNIQIKNKEGYQNMAKKNDLKGKQKQLDMEDDDEQIDQLEKIKMKLRKQLKQKKAMGKIK